MKPLKEYSIDEIWELYQNKFRGLVIVMRESRRLLKHFQISEIEYPGEKALLVALENYQNRKIRLGEEE